MKPIPTNTGIAPCNAYTGDCGVAPCSVIKPSVLLRLNRHSALPGVAPCDALTCKQAIAPCNILEISIMLSDESQSAMHGVSPCNVGESGEVLRRDRKAPALCCTVQRTGLIMTLSGARPGNLRQALRNRQEPGPGFAPLNVHTPTGLLHRATPPNSAG